jgi:hypothetical protein
VTSRRANGEGSIFPYRNGFATEASDAWLPMPDIVVAALKIGRTQQDGEREAAGEIWQQTSHTVTCLHRAFWHSDRSPHSQQEVHRTLRGRGSASADRS